MPTLRLSIRTKLLGSALVLIAFAGLISAVSIGRLADAKDAGHRLYHKAYEPSVAAIAVNGAVNDIKYQTEVYTVLVVQNGGQQPKLDAPAVVPIVNAVKKDEAELVALLPTLRRVTGPERATALKLATSVTTYTKLLNEALTSTDKQTPEQYAKADKARRAALETISSLSASLAKAGNVAAADADHDIARSFTSSRTIVLLCLAFAVLFGLGLAWIMSATIRRGVAGIGDRLRALRENDTASLREGLAAVAEGDLSRRAVATTDPLERLSSDEIGQIGHMVNEIREDTATSIDRYNAALDGLGAMIGQVSASADSLSVASREMSTTSSEAGRAVTEVAAAIGEVARGAERQANVVENTKGMTEVMVLATAESAATAEETARAAQTTREVATRGAKAVAEATEAMTAVRDASAQATDAIRELGAKSEQIGGIVDAITSIAEQTNLLALNAAIEAARAGEQGRGFAVVAEEVRKLAEESQRAAASIADLIGEIQQETQRAVEVVESGSARTDQGAETVRQARTAFDEINAEVEDMTARVSQIAAAVGELSETSRRMGSEISELAAAAEQTSASTQQVSASTEETSASTQQIAAAAQTLSATADELRHLVDRFTLVG
jgi:methyl-accepting chemotaxis protein